MTSSGGGTSRSDDGGRQRRRALRAHADLFASAIKEETDRLSKLANVVEALIQAGDGHIVEAMQVADTHVAGVCVLGARNLATELWWDHEDPHVLVDSARARQVARMLLQQNREAPNAWFYEAQELAELWERSRRRRVQKVMTRMRGRNQHPRDRTPRKRR